MDTFEVREDDVPIERVLMHDARMLDDRIGDRVFVLTREVITAPRTLLVVVHTPDNSDGG